MAGAATSASIVLSASGLEALSGGCSSKLASSSSPFLCSSTISTHQAPLLHSGNHSRDLSVQPTSADLLLKQKGLGRSGRMTVNARVTPMLTATSAALEPKVKAPSAGTSGRRELLATGVSLLALQACLPEIASAAAVPKGLAVHADTTDGYTFLYPFGWQEIAVRGLDVVYRDVIEPLESVSVSVLPTQKKSIEEIGTPQEVAQQMIDKVLTPQGQKSVLINVTSRNTEGKSYVTLEYKVDTGRYVRHALTTVAVRDGKFFTLTVGSNERRWERLSPNLQIVADSFNLLF